MKKIFGAMALGAMLFLAKPAAADTIFYDVKQEGYVFDSTANTTKTWVFDLNNDVLFGSWSGSGDPYPPPILDINAEDIITSAWLRINFYDADYILNANGKEKNIFKEFADLTVDGEVVFTDKEIDSITYYLNINRKLNITLLDDHLLEVTIDCLGGDFEVYNLFVGGKFIDNAPIPEPNTTLLVGIGIAGFAAAGRRKRGKSSNVER
jgi:hypothetical protein